MHFMQTAEALQTRDEQADVLEGSISNLLHHEGIELATLLVLQPSNFVEILGFGPTRATTISEDIEWRVVTATSTHVQPSKGQN